MVNWVRSANTILQDAADILDSLILKSPNGHFFKLSVTNTGDLTTEPTIPLAALPSIPTVALTNLVDLPAKESLAGPRATPHAHDQYLKRGPKGKNRGFLLRAPKNNSIFRL